MQSKLFAVWMRLIQFKESNTNVSIEQAEELEQIAADLDDIREEDIRGISHRLHPSIVRVGAAVGLRSLRNFYESMISVELEINEAAAQLEPAGTSVIPDSMRLGVYRIAELAMGNVAKHAEATVCMVGWSYEELEQQLVMTITDDGIGFDPAQVLQTGLGMVNIGDYADAMNATLEIDSKPGRGTRLKLVIPFVAPINVEEPTGQQDQAEQGFEVGGVTGEQTSAA